MHKKKENLKLKRPHRYSIQMGIGIQHNFDLAAYYIENDSWNTSLYPVYSAAIYRKYNITPHISSNGRDYSESNFIGFKNTYMNASRQYDLDKGWKEVPAEKIQEIEFSWGPSNKRILSVGILSKDISQKMIDYPQYYSVTLSRRFYALPLEFTLDLKGYFNESEFYPVIKLSSNINLNFKRIINSRDRKRLRYEIKQIY